MTMPPSPRRRWAPRAAAAYLAAVLVTWAAIEGGGDSEGWPTLMLFGPRWLIGLPLVVLFAGAAVARSYLAGGLALLAAAVVAGPVCGGGVSVGPHLRPNRDALLRLRVVTWNMGGVKPGAAFDGFLSEVRPDIVLFQEAGPDLDPARLPKGWTLTKSNGLRVATRFPVRETGNLSAAELGAPGGGRRYRLDTEAGRLDLVNLHLPTVRPGIEAALGSRLRDLGPLENAIAVRARAAELARVWAGPPAANVLVAGDFNTPACGRIYAANWAGFGNAYSDAGTGWGTTKQTTWFGVRIDHILYAPPWRCRAAWVGPAMGSDHRPMIADLVLEQE